MAYQLNFNSDNCSSACPEVMAALIAANSGEQGSYGIDAETAKVAELLKQAFETDALQSYPVATGTAANALAVASSDHDIQTSRNFSRLASLFVSFYGAPHDAAHTTFAKEVNTFWHPAAGGGAVTSVLQVGEQRFPEYSAIEGDAQHLYSLLGTLGYANSIVFLSGYSPPV